MGHHHDKPNSDTDCERASHLIYKFLSLVRNNFTAPDPNGTVQSPRTALEEAHPT